MKINTRTQIKYKYEKGTPLVFYESEYLRRKEVSIVTL